MSTRGTRRSSKRKASLEAVKDTSKVTKNTFTEKDTEEHFQQGDVILMALVDQFSILDPSQANDKKNIIEGIFGSPDDLYEALRVKNPTITHQMPIGQAKLRLVYAAIEKMDDTMITLTKKKILELVHSISAPSTLDPFHRAVVLYVLLLSPWTLDVLEDMDKPEPLIVKISQVMLELSNQLQTRILDWLHVSWQETFQLELIDTDNNDKEMSPTSPTSTNLLTITTPNSASTVISPTTSTTTIMTRSRSKRGRPPKYSQNPGQINRDEALELFKKVLKGFDDLSNAQIARKIETQQQQNYNQTHHQSPNNINPFSRYLMKFQDGLSYILKGIVQESNGKIQLAMKHPSVESTIRCIDLMYQHNLTYKLIPPTLFYNDQLSEVIDFHYEYGYYKTNEPNSCLNFPYILNLAAKFEVLRYESAIQMRNELHDTFFRVMFEGVKCPYLVLEIRRDHLVRDTMYQLDIKSSMDLRKQLKVRFVGEEGVDEGGVQKEFFQLLIREIFDPKYGMFQMNEESGLYWFKPQTVIDDSTLEELRLMGQLLGLAVYNAVILDTHFPVAMYKRLVNENVTLDDVKQLDPPLYRSLNQILNHMTREEIEACDRAFEVDMDTFDNKGSVELVEGGSNIPLTYSNRRDFVERYVDYLFNKSCQKQLEAFQQGFDRICQDSIIKTYRPDELELLICGSSDLDFEALESSATYDGGYNSETPVVRYFWEVVQAFSDEQRKKLLFFTTGSDRVPIGGLGKMPFVIAKNGGDSERLPTSHTCFNVLLLPEYVTKEKLLSRLTTAINNAEGFGMI